jgi:hypothetical protein
MGTVILCITDDDGVKHELELTCVNYLPHSPVIHFHFVGQQNSIPMNMGVLSNTALVSIRLMTLILSIGIKSNSAKHFTMRIQAYQNVSLLLVTENCQHSHCVWLDTKMTQFIGNFYLKSRIGCSCNKLPSHKVCIVHYYGKEN